MKRLHIAALTAAALLTLTGCSEEASVKESAVTVKPTSEINASSDGACAEGDATSEEVKVEFGGITAASDEWSQALGKEWRHYYPVTVTNLSDSNCLFALRLDATTESGEVLNEDFGVPLKPWQVYKAQAFDLEEIVEFNDDAKDAKPTESVTPSVYRIGKSPLWPDYYDSEIKIKGIEGKNENVSFVFDVTVKNLKENASPRLASSEMDSIILNGFNDKGEIIATARTSVDAPKIGEKLEVKAPVAGGDASQWVRNQIPLSKVKEAVKWEIGMFQPEFTEAQFFEK